MEVIRPRLISSKMVSKYGLICLVSMLSIVALCG